MSLKGIKRKTRVIQELFHFLWEQKLWWMIPMVVLLIVFAVLLIFAQSTPLAPFIYTLF